MLRTNRCYYLKLSYVLARMLCVVVLAYESIVSHVIIPKAYIFFWYKTGAYILVSTCLSWYSHNSRHQYKRISARPRSRLVYRPEGLCFYRSFHSLMVYLFVIHTWPLVIGLLKQGSFLQVLDLQSFEQIRCGEVKMRCLFMIATCWSSQPKTREKSATSFWDDSI